MKQRILVVGSLNLDLIYHLPHLPAAGATITALHTAHAAGGKGANQAAAAAKLGGNVAMIGAVGNDEAAQTLRDALSVIDADTNAIATLAEPTGTAIILLTPDGQNSIVVAPGANGALTPEHIAAQEPLFQDAALVLTQLETPLAVLEATLTLAEAACVAVMLDPAPAAPLSPQLLQRIAWFTPNETEAAFYAQHTGAPRHFEGEALCRHFQSLGIRNVLLKLGARGAALLIEDGAYMEAAAPHVQVKDTTAAGDTLNAAFATRLAAGATHAEALQYAVTAASLATTKAGAFTSLPTHAEVLAERSRQLARLERF